MEDALCCHACREGPSAGTGPRALIAHAGGWLGGELAEALLAVVHHRGDFRQVGLAFGIVSCGTRADHGRLRLRRAATAGAGGSGRR